MALFCLAGCASKHDASVQVNKIKQGLARKYHLPYGDTVARFGIGKTPKDGLFDGCYGNYINRADGVDDFLNTFDARYENEKQIREGAREKLDGLRKRLWGIHKKYKILPGLVNGIPMSAGLQDTKNPLRELDSLYMLARYIPLGKPMCASYLSSGFGNRKHPIKKTLRLHSGIDLVGKVGSKIFAIADGKVIIAKKLNGYGNTVVLKHGGGLTSKYAHLADFSVTEGQHIIFGQEIGTQGKTGNATNDHLHLEVRIHKKPVDPGLFVGY